MNEEDMKALTILVTGEPPSKEREEEFKKEMEKTFAKMEELKAKTIARNERLELLAKKTEEREKNDPRFHEILRKLEKYADSVEPEKDSRNPKQYVLGQGYHTVNPHIGQEVDSFDEFSVTKLAVRAANHLLVANGRSFEEAKARAIQELEFSKAYNDLVIYKLEHLEPENP